MNSFSNMEINDLLDNRFRLEEKHTPNYLAECFQRLFPTLGRMGLSTVIDEMARANHRAFNSSKLPIRGETLDLNFFFELWKRNFRFEGGIYDKFIFSDELRLAFKINSREFWEVLVRADRDLGNYLKDSIELLKYRDLPREISLNLRLNGSSPDDKTIRLLREKLPYSKENVTTHEIAKVCLQLFEAANPADYDVRRLAEELEKENGIRRLNGEFTAVLPKKALDRLSTRCVLEFFKNKPLASNEASAMERGVYTVTEADLVLINSQGSEAFWQSIIPDKSIRERTLNMWKLAGMDSDARRFAKGKQILIATERALSDALHKHSAEMRDVYPLCGRAGISTQEADKFMAMLYLCHDFYKGLANVYINTAMLARFGAPAARRLWDTIKTEGLKKDGVGKIQSRLETETEKLNREAKEAIANGTAKVTAIDLKLLDEQGTTAKFDWGKKRLFGIAALIRGDSGGKPEIPALAQQELLLRGENKAQAKEIFAYNDSDLFSGKVIADLETSFQAKIRNLGISFKKLIESGSQTWVPIPITSTIRNAENQAQAMINLYMGQGNRLAEIYSSSSAKPLLQIIDSSILNNSVDPLVGEWINKKNCPEHIKAGIIKVAQLFSSIESRKESAKKLLVSIMESGLYGYISAHRIGKAVDVSGGYIYNTQLRDHIRIDYSTDFSISAVNAYADKHIHIGNK